MLPDHYFVLTHSLIIPICFCSFLSFIVLFSHFFFISLYFLYFFLLFLQVSFDYLCSCSLFHSEALKFIGIKWQEPVNFYLKPWVLFVAGFILKPFKHCFYWQCYSKWWTFTRTHGNRQIPRQESRTYLAGFILLKIQTLAKLWYKVASTVGMILAN